MLIRNLNVNSNSQKSHKQAQRSRQQQTDSDVLEVKLLFLSMESGGFAEIKQLRFQLNSEDIANT